jgi:hypothetical protein
MGFAIPNRENRLTISELITSTENRKRGIGGSFFYA